MPEEDSSAPHRQPSLGAGLAGLLATVALLLTLLVLLLMERHLGPALKRSLGTGLAQRAAATAGQLDVAMFERYREVQLLAARLAWPAGTGTLRRQLDEVQRSYPLYAWLGLADPGGQVRAASGGLLEGASVAQQAWWRDAPRGVYLHDVHPDPRLERLLPGGRPLQVVDLAFPLYDASGHATGVLAAQLNWHWVRQAVAHDTLVLARSGTVLAGPDAWLGRTLDSASVREAARQPAGHVEEMGDDGKAYLVGYARTRGYDGYPGLGWNVQVRQDAASALAPLRRLQILAALAGAGLAVLLGAAGWYAARRLTQPVLQAAQALRAAGSADAAALPPALPPPAGWRELRSLVGACHALWQREYAQRQQLARDRAAGEQQLAARGAALEAAAGANAAQLEAVLQAAREAVLVVTLDGVVVDWNRRAGEIFGWERAAALGMALDQLLHTGPGLLAGLADGSIGQPVALAGWRRSGARFDAELSLARYPAQAGTDAARYALCVTDVTESRRSEEAAAAQLSALASAQLELAEKERFLRTVADHNPAAIAYVDRDEIFSFANRSCQGWLGVDPASMIGRSVEEVLGEAQYAQSERHVGAALRGERVHFESDVAGTAGTRHFMTDYIPDTDVQGAVCGFHIVALDITARRRAELQQQEASRAKSAFLANMSHEIRTPMNAVLGIGQLLERTPLNAEQREYVRLIRASGSALLAVVNDILDLSKIEAGKLAVVAAPFQLDELAASVAAAMQAASVGKRLDLLLTQDPDMPQALVGDVQRLRQVALNLVGNAIKFTAEGEVRVHLGTSGPGSAVEILQLTVSDSGIGMSSEQLGRLFNPFEQADTSTARRFGGTGLGLSISQQLVQLMGGAITVSSEAGRGSEFVVSVPLQLAQRQRADAADDGALAGLRVLLVDDHVPTLHYLEAQLARWGCAVEACAAIPAATAARWEVALVDSVLLDAQAGAPAPALCGAACVVALNRSLDRQPGAGESAALAKPVLPAVLRELLRSLRGQGAPGAAPPAGAAAGALAAVPPALPVAGSAALRGARILLVEDNPTNQLVTSSMLEPFGAVVTVAAHGQQALDLLRAGPAAFDLVLMDVQMPVMDGFEATRALRRQLGLRLPVLAMSAGVLDTEQALCRECGMDGFIPKPVDQAYLLATMAAHLGRTAGAGAKAGDAAGDAKELPALDLQPGVFAVRKLLSMIGNGPQRQDIVHLVGRVVRQSQAEFEAARARWQAGDATGAAAALHALRGGVGSLGARQFADATLVLEQALRSGDSAAAASQFAAAQAALSATLAAAARWLQAEQAMPDAGVQQDLQTAMHTLADMLHERR